MGRSIKTIQAEIEDRQKALQRLDAEAAGLKRRAAAQERVLWSGLGNELHELAGQLQALRASAPPSWSDDWDSARWGEAAEGAQASPLLEIRAGAVAESETIDGETALDDVPALFPLLQARGPILLLCDESTQGAARALLQSMLLRAAVAMPAELRFTLVDALGMGAAYPFRGALARVRPSARGAAEEFGEVLEDIRRINHAVVGTAERLLDLGADQRAGEPFEIVAVADFPKAFIKDPRALEQLVRIGNSGARAGRHLIMEAAMDQSLPHDFSWDQFENAVKIDLRQPVARWDRPPSGQRQRELLEEAVRSGLRTEVGDWDSVVAPAQWQQGDASLRVETPVGERLRFWLGDDDDGRPSAHCMLAGQTGSGKSFLMHVLITGLAARYSPAELRFVLVDGKQGVEFEAYRNLPHADVVCLRTSPATARSVLEDFAAEMDDRYEAFLRVGAVKLEDYRRKTGQRLPRRLMIVDEYQQLLEGDPERGAALLAKILEKGRAAGIHLVLGSQTFNAPGMPASAMTHVHLRVSLSLAQDYVQGLQAFGTEGKRLIRELAPSGQAVINDESGRDGANARGAVARFTRTAERDPHAEALARIAGAGGADGETIVLSGRDAATLDDNPWVPAWRAQRPEPARLQEVARMPARQGGFGVDTWSQADEPLPLWFGRQFDVRGHALSVLRRGPAQNLLALGPHTDLRATMLGFSLAALGTVVDPARIELLLLDGLEPGLPGAGILPAAARSLQSRGAQVERAGRDDGGVALERFVERHFAAGRGATIRLLVVSEPEYLEVLHAPSDSFVPPQDGAPAALRQAIAKGPQSGLHVLLTATGTTAMGTVLSPTREARHFNHRVVQQMNEDESMTLFSSLAAARIADQAAGHPHAALAVDMVRGVRAASLFRAYAPAADPHGRLDEAAFAAALQRILGGAG